MSNKSSDTVNYSNPNGGRKELSKVNFLKVERDLRYSPGIHLDAVSAKKRKPISAKCLETVLVITAESFYRPLRWLVEI